ncbi:MAG TPA: polyribonucleotide nucleotidyltransferase [Candidatus Magasanikbacteria bacterium]|nr:polyribonucleotide nucleotidyltransferase [Candidatus Magasanikbacteria bacterium]
MEIKNWSTDWGGRKLTIEVGKFVPQAHGSCTVQYGDTVMLATVIKSKGERDNIDYFPLMVDFEEKLYAAGKIKGSRFIKREGRPSDEAILTGRMVDRAIRPLFDERLRNDVQVVLTALSIDGENDAAITSLVAASCAICISNVPWDGPIAGARIGLDENNEFVLNISADKVDTSKLDLVVAGTPEKLIMVEAGANEVNEQTMLKAMQWGSEQLKPVLELIAKIQKEIGKTKDDVEKILDEAGDVKKRVAETKKIGREFLKTVADEMVFNSKKITKAERIELFNNLEKELAKILTEKEFTPDEQKPCLKEVKYLLSEVVTKKILENDQRLDGRKLTEIRDLHAEIDLLPRVHGTGFFKRGDTHVLSVVTLGAPGDMQTLDTMEEEGKKRYMHHYNDGPYSYGETGMMRGPGRRAIGHGALAERALFPVLPEEESFPYAIRVVSEVMSSNGSSSMASTCGSTLSLMAAGVPIKKPVAGIAMGLASDAAENNGTVKNWKVLTDLQDVEDGPGGMDFKIAGTIDGITAIQMDTKTHGLPWDLVEQTLKQAREARLQILGVMASVIAEPRKELSPYAPRIETIKIDPEKIGDVIGPGGKTIKKIIEETGVDIDIEQDGRVLITSVDSEGMQKAIKMVLDLTKEIEPGEIYEGKVVRLEDFGAFVNILPGKDGLVHVSEISWNRVGRPSDVLKIGDTAKVKVKEIDNLGRVNLTIKGLLPRPEGMTDRPPMDRGNFGPSAGSGQAGGAPAKKGFFRRDK